MKDHINQFYCRNTGWLERPLLDNSKKYFNLGKDPERQTENYRNILRKSR